MTEISQVVLSFFRSGINVNEHYFKLKRTTCTYGLCHQDFAHFLL